MLGGFLFVGFQNRQHKKIYLDNLKNNLWTVVCIACIIDYIKEFIMAKIVVIGMGQGGMVSAIKLASAGHDVTVFEKSAENMVGYDWKDDIRSDVFGLVDIPMPDSNVYCQKCKWLFVSPNEEFSMPVPPLAPMEEISVYRQGLCKHFATLAIDAGCKIIYGKEVKKLIVEGDAVCGVVVDGEEFRCDLVIDASGLRSKLRGQIPNKFGVQAQPTNNDIMFGYRAFFNHTPNTCTREKGIDSTVVLKHLGSKGISWCNLNEEDEVDVLIGRVGGLDDSEIESALSALRASNPILGDTLIRERKVEICLRSSIARAVADGYVAIGDSAFMTMPLMGSGIEAGMKAGKMFADHVISNDLQSFKAEDMWGFYAEYMRTYGAEFSFIDVVKRWALSLKPQRIDWVFGGGLIEKEDLLLISTEEGADKPKMSAKSILKKAFLLLTHFGLLCSAIGCISRALKAKRIAKAIPQKYDEKKLAKWTKKYNDIIDKSKY